MAQCAVKKSHRCWGESPSKLVASHLCGCTVKGRSKRGRRCEEVDDGGSDVKARMEKGQLLCQEKWSTKGRQEARALSQD